MVKYLYTFLFCRQGDMELFSIVFFLVVLYGFGSSVSFIAKESDDFLERNLMRLGIGLGVMLLFGFLLNVLKIPLDWRIFLGLGILILIAKSYFDYRKNKTIIPKFNLNFYSILMNKVRIRLFRK